MPPLNASAASGAASNVDVEPTHQRLAGNLDLELVIDVILLGSAATVGALLGQRDIDDLIGFLFGQGAVGLGAIVRAALAPGRGRRVFGRPLGERRGLALGRAQDFLELRGQLTDLRLQVGHPLLKLFVGGLGHP